MTTTGQPPQFVIRSSPGLVETWSTKRLQFQPLGWQRSWRDELVSALRSLSSAGDLSATYTSAAPDLVDAENVLFYNVGNAAFAHLTTHSLRFERSFADPAPTPPGLDLSPTDYHSYRTGPPSSTLDAWSVDRVVAAWSDIALPNVGSLTASRVWAATAARVIFAGEESTKRFGLRLRLTGTRGRPLIGLVKPLLDGVISAFHRSEPYPSVEVMTRLAASSGEPSVTVMRRLLAEQGQVLGGRALIRLTRDGISWNPRDEDCVACSMVGVAHGPRAMSGELFTVAAATDSACRLEELSAPPARKFSDDDWARLQRGVYTTESGDRWWAVAQDAVVWLLRAGNGMLIFQIELAPADGAWAIRRAWARAGHDSAELDDALWREVLRKSPQLPSSSAPTRQAIAPHRGVDHAALSAAVSHIASMTIFRSPGPDLDTQSPAAQAATKGT